MIAALYVLSDGPYAGLPDVEVWDRERDARTYAGPWPVVAHPPCERWGRFWYGGPSCKERKTLGDDGGCFAAAFHAVNTFGGVLEHPADSYAFSRFGITPPRKVGGWDRAGLWLPGHVCHVEQGRYGHLARKATWLYAVGCELPDLQWGPSRPLSPIGNTGSKGGKGGRLSESPLAWMPKRLRHETPIPFRDVLIQMARSVSRGIARP